MEWIVLLTVIVLGGTYGFLSLLHYIYIRQSSMILASLARIDKVYEEIFHAEKWGLSRGPIIQKYGLPESFRTADIYTITLEYRFRFSDELEREIKKRTIQNAYAFLFKKNPRRYYPEKYKKHLVIEEYFE